MSDTRVVNIPSMALVYEDGTLDSIGMGGEVYKRTRNNIDRHSYEEGYADGFDRGEEAIIQQVDGILNEEDWSDHVVARLNDFIRDFWKERES